MPGTVHHISEGLIYHLQEGRGKIEMDLRHCSGGLIRQKLQGLCYFDFIHIKGERYL